jgi:hypothetical protein
MVRQPPRREGSRCLESDSHKTLVLVLVETQARACGTLQLEQLAHGQLASQTPWHGQAAVSERQRPESVNSEPLQASLPVASCHGDSDRLGLGLGLGPGPRPRGRAVAPPGRDPRPGAVSSSSEVRPAAGLPAQELPPSPTPGPGPRRSDNARIPSSTGTSRRVHR